MIDAPREIFGSDVEILFRTAQNFSVISDNDDKIIN